MFHSNPWLQHAGLKPPVSPSRSCRSKSSSTKDTLPATATSSRKARELGVVLGRGEWRNRILNKTVWDGNNFIAIQLCLFVLFDCVQFCLVVPNESGSIDPSLNRMKKAGRSKEIEGMLLYSCNVGWSHWWCNVCTAARSPFSIRRWKKMCKDAFYWAHVPYSIVNIDNLPKSPWYWPLGCSHPSRKNVFVGGPLVSRPMDVSCKVWVPNWRFLKCIYKACRAFIYPPYR